MSEGHAVGARLGVVGGGQLGRMMAEAAAPLGVELVVLDPTANAPAAPVSASQIVGHFDDEAGIEELARQVDALTFEIELADPDALQRISEVTGTPVQPSPDTLRMIQDKLVQNQALQDAGIPVPRFAAVDSVADAEQACESFGYPVMLKARTGGYDGRGNLPIESPEDIASAMEAIAGPALIEEFVDFRREISVIGVKGVDDRRCFEPTENIHEEEILRESIVPARVGEGVRKRALAVADDVLDEVDGRGVYGIELFEADDGTVLVNEIAPRPHNSGHWTIEGAVCSQFEQHVRAVLGLPLGSTRLRTPIVTANILGDVSESLPARPTGLGAILEADDAHLHWYGKHEVRPLRKMGHIAVYRAEDDRDELLEAARTYVDRVTFQ